MSTPDPVSLIDTARLASWMDGHALECGPISESESLCGGTQNILVRFRRGSRYFVLRRGPAHLRPQSNQTISREARVLSALASTRVPHPTLYAACNDESVLGAAFYLMEPVEGFNPRGTLPVPHSAEPAMRRRMGLALVEGIAELGALDYVSLGLADLGRTTGFLERQVSRWRSQLDSYAEYAGWQGPAELGDVSGVGSWLERCLPPAFTPGIMHGDYHLSNVMYRHDSAELAAIVDWELTTIGDPLIDLGWLIATWPEPDGQQFPGVVGTAPWDGFPTVAELVEHYGRCSARNLEHLRWYTVVACYKLAIILEGTYARACARKSDLETGERLHSAAQTLLRRARLWLSAD